jgi:glucose/arabinose dehydrogenase
MAAGQAWGKTTIDAARLAAGEYEDFMTGFVISDQQVWGRPVGVVVAQDGSLFVTEDGNGTVWRITHQPTVSGIPQR